MLPNYKDGSILNLMSTIARATGGRTPYNPLKGIDASQIKNKTVVLIIIDGMGAEFVKKNSNGFLQKNKARDMTSVFPATTAAAVTTFATGLAPQQHGLPAFYLNMKEIGMLFEPLPFVPKIGGWISNEIKGKDLLELKPFNRFIKAKPYIVLHKQLINSEYNAVCKNYKKKAHTTLNGFFEKIKEAAKEKGNKYVYAYWGDLDMWEHETGTKSKKTINHFKQIEKGLQKLAKQLKNTTLIITADHGLTDIKQKLNINNYPKIMDCLSMPLGGEGSTAFAHVKAKKAKQFKKLVKQKLSKYCKIYSSEELINKNIYGPGKANKKLYDRTGDFTLIAKEHCTIKSFMLGQKVRFNKGHHAGLSKEEMIVPLIIIRT